MTAKKRKLEEGLTLDEYLYLKKTLSNDAEMWLDNFLTGEDHEEALENIITIGTISRKLYKLLIRRANQNIGRRARK